MKAHAISDTASTDRNWHVPSSHNPSGFNGGFTKFPSVQYFSVYTLQLCCVTLYRRPLLHERVAHRTGRW